MPEKENSAPVLRIFVAYRVVQSGLLATVPEILERDQPLKRRLGEEKYTLFGHYVNGLLQGESFLLQDIVDNNLDPSLIRKKARNILSSFQIRLAHLNGLESNMSKVKSPSKKDLALQDPNVFLGDAEGEDKREDD